MFISQKVQTKGSKRYKISIAKGSKRFKFYFYEVTKTLIGLKRFEKDPNSCKRTIFLKDQNPKSP
jgi:hypothetical protein